MPIRAANLGGNQTPRAAVDDAIASVRRFYTCGRQSQARSPERMAHGQMADEAQRFKLHPEMLRTARLFASSYTPAGVEKLCAMARVARFPLGVTAIIRLITIPEQHRTVFQRELIERRWSTKQLNLQIMRRFGKRKNSGRNRRQPQDEFEACYQISRLCDQWRRLCASLVEPDDSGPKARKSLPLRRDLSPVVRKNIRNVDRAMTRLAKVASKRLSKQD